MFRFVPLFIKIKYLAVTNHVKIILILRDAVGAKIQQLGKSLFNLDLTHFFEVHNENSCVKIFVSGNFKHDLRVTAENINICHDLLGNCSYEVVSHRTVVKPCNVTIYDDITIEIKSPFVFGKHIRNEKTVIGRFRVIIPDVKPLAKIL